MTASQERIPFVPGVKASRDVDRFLSHDLQLAENMPSRLSDLLHYLTSDVQNGLTEIRGRGGDIFIAGPEWCRENPVDAGKFHSQVILKTYGNTYALPNKDPEANTRALIAGNLDMFLMLENDKPVGTACMVTEQQGIAELGRAASLGRVGNRVIQDMRVLRWLTDDQVANKFHTLFSTCRTAPDRNIGTQDKPEIMRGGQAVSHMWQAMPEVRVAGFGPFYKKHGALEQFAYSFITKGEIEAEDDMWVRNGVDADFIQSWFSGNGFDSRNIEIRNASEDRLEDSRFHISYPPHETGITDLVHGEIGLGHGDLSLSDAVDQLSETGVPFMQIRIPVDQDTLAIQADLTKAGFQAFLFTPALADIQSSALWFGKLNADVPVVPTFWADEILSKNPFWKGNLAMHSNRIAQNWKY